MEFCKQETEISLIQYTGDHGEHLADIDVTHLPIPLLSRLMVVLGEIAELSQSATDGTCVSGQGFKACGTAPGLAAAAANLGPKPQGGIAAAEMQGRLAAAESEVLQ